MRKQSSNIWTFCALVSVSLLFACQPKPVHYTKAPAGLPDEQSDSVRVVAMTGNKVDYILEADHTDRFYEKKVLYAKKVRVVQYNDKDSTYSTLTCDRAEMDEVGNILTAIGDVVIVSDNGKMRTEKLVWYRDTDSLYAEGKVMVLRGEDVLEGFELRTDINLDHVSLTNVTATGVLDAKKMDF
jgi:LPS export ABC transporter protein LptC